MVSLLIIIITIILVKTATCISNDDPYINNCADQMARELYSLLFFTVGLNLSILHPEFYPMHVLQYYLDCYQCCRLSSSLYYCIFLLWLAMYS